MTLQNSAPANQPLNWAAMGRGLVIALALTVMLSLIATAALHWSSLSERFLPWIAAVILFVSAFFGGSAASARAGGKGLLHGLGVGIGFLILTWVLGTFLVSAPITPLGLLQKSLLILCAAALGGILGVTLTD